MTTNGDKYKPIQTRPKDKDKFDKICKKLNTTSVDGFSLAIEAWRELAEVQIDND